MASATQKRSKPELPIPTGPYTVGCTDVMTGTGGDSIFFRLYYPTALTNIHVTFSFDFKAKLQLTNT